jgi:hypothetical protein
MMYRHLNGRFSLSQYDDKWRSLETADHTGFRGLVSLGGVVGDCDPQNFSEKGYMRRYQDKSGVSYVLEDSDVVGFESRPSDDIGVHTMVSTYTLLSGTFPPNTLLRLRKIVPAGQWEAPGGIYPKQRLLVVTATYLMPSASLLGSLGSEGSGSKLCDSVQTLSYGNRVAYIEGIDGLISHPVLTMDMECDRDTTWTDWKHKTYSLRDEYAYVNGTAKVAMNCTPGTRDEHHDGWTPQHFLQEANAYITERRKQGYGTLIPEEKALLTIEEVVALRLYSGPAYQILNDFLRQVSTVVGSSREKLVTNATLTFTATLRHICCGIRKLAAVVNEQEQSAPLWRGVRGQLPESFFTHDAQGLICAVDMAFMSTSKNRQTPIDYMGPGENVLWELRPMEESDAAFHCGADISMLSQFAGEQEVLFPPCTMLQVKKGVSAVQPTCPRDSVVEDKAVGKTYSHITVLPHFL